MIKETPKIVKEHTVMEKQKHCDVCDKKITRDLGCSVARCEMCHKDLCNDCVFHEKDTMGDYREVFCKSCWECGEDHRRQIMNLELEIDSIHNRWVEECLRRK